MHRPAEIATLRQTHMLLLEHGIFRPGLPLVTLMRYKKHLLVIERLFLWGYKVHVFDLKLVYYLLKYQVMWLGFYIYIYIYIYIEREREREGCNHQRHWDGRVFPNNYKWPNCQSTLFVFRITRGSKLHSACHCKNDWDDQSNTSRWGLWFTEQSGDSSAMCQFSVEREWGKRVVLPPPPP